MMRAWPCSRYAVWGLLLLGGCVARALPRDVPQGGDREQKSAPGAISSDPPSEHGRSALGFVLESTLRARRIHHGRSAMLLELSNGATVIDGDRLQVSIRTSQDAYLYLAFCSQHAKKDPRYSGLKVFPDDGALHVRAYEPTIAPDKAAEIVLDDKPGQESLYLILSRGELSSADSELTQVLASARQGIQGADCGSPLRATAAGSRIEHKAGKVRSVTLQPRGGRPVPAGALKRAGREEDPVVEIQRGGDIVWNNGAMELGADAEGIVILRYGLTHVAAP
jgi:hypothetical protein